VRLQGDLQKFEVDAPEQISAAEIWGSSLPKTHMANAGYNQTISRDPPTMCYIPGSM